MSESNGEGKSPERERGTEPRAILITANYNGVLALWNVEEANWSIMDSKCPANPSHDYAINKIIISEDRRFLAAACSNGLRLYSIGDKKILEKSFVEDKANVTALGWSANGDWIFYSTEAGSLMFYDFRKSYKYELYRQEEDITCACLNPNQVEIFFGDTTGHIKIYSLETKNVKLTLNSTKNAALRCIAISSDGSFLCAGNDMGSVFLWNLRAQDNLFECKDFKCHENIILSLKISASNRYVIASSADKTLGIFEFRQESGLGNFKQYFGHTGWVWDFELHSDECHLISVSTDGCMIIWNIQNAKLVKKIVQSASTDKCAKDNRDISKRGYISIALKS